MLNLSVPDADPALQHTVETRPKAVAAWLERLPLASPADTAQQLVTTLYALNRQPLGTDERTALQALYRPVVERVAVSLEALLADAGVPPSAQLRQVGALLRELRIEYGIGYKQMLLSLTNRRFGRPTPKRLAEFTAWLLAALRDIQVVCYLTYTPPPEDLWQDLHQLNAYARDENLDAAAADTMPPPSLAYRQALLLALADPPHLNHAELVHTRFYLDQFARLSVLTAAPVAGHHGFSIHTHGNAPPSHLAAGQDSGLWLDTEAVCRRLYETVSRLRAGGTPRSLGLPPEMEGELSLTLGKHLLKLWSSAAQRAFKRHATPGSTVQMVAGVSAIHRLLDPVPPASRIEAEDGSLPIGDVGVMPAAPVAVQATRWAVDNDSASGLALSGTPDTPLNLKVGDPLALRTDDAAAWSLGVIRWVRMRDTQQVELGVERLSPQVQPVWVRTLRPLRGQRKPAPEPALWVPGLAALKQPDRLLLPRGLYQAAMDAEVRQASRHLTLTFGHRIEHTPSFDLIDFTLFEDEQP
jgi:hypothetical protein